MLSQSSIKLTAGQTNRRTDWRTDWPGSGHSGSHSSNNWSTIKGAKSFALARRPTLSFVQRQPPCPRSFLYPHCTLHFALHLQLQLCQSRRLRCSCCCWRCLQQNRIKLHVCRTIKFCIWIRMCACVHICAYNYGYKSESVFAITIFTLVPQQRLAKAGRAGGQVATMATSRLPELSPLPNAVHDFQNVLLKSVACMCYQHGFFFFCICSDIFLNCCQLACQSNEKRTCYYFFMRILASWACCKRVQFIFHRKSLFLRHRACVPQLHIYTHMRIHIYRTVHKYNWICIST